MRGISNPRVRSCCIAIALLLARRSPSRTHDPLEDVAPFKLIRKHAETRTPWREQDDVSFVRQFPGHLDRLRHIVESSGDNAFPVGPFDRLREPVGCRAFQYNQIAY